MSTLMSRWSSPMPLRMVWPDSWSVDTRNDGSSAASFASATPSFSWSAFDFGSIAISTSHGCCVWMSSGIAQSQGLFSRPFPQFLRIDVDDERRQQDEPADQDFQEAIDVDV